DAASRRAADRPVGAQMSVRASHIAPAALTTATLVRLGQLTNRTLVLPLLIFFPTGRCNSRCISCDWWKQSGADDLTIDEIRRLARSLPSLRTRLVVFSGGEPLLRPEVFDAADAFLAHDIALHLLTSGVLLERFADRVGRRFSRVVVSLDATSDALYERIRGVNALGTVARGVARLRREAPRVPITGRATLHRTNFRELPRLIDHAHALGLDAISFLPADVSPRAFGRDGAPDLDALALDADEVIEFKQLVERTIAAYADDLESGFVSESPDRLRRLPQYYAALRGDAPFPAVSCSAPWVSVVVEANGSVRPCFFHGVVGNIREMPLERIVSDNLRRFRDRLDVGANPVCERCVCSLNTSWRSAPWT
ncbi:MAG TPA: radical SAM protein, partial [Vicinamibacterales bacterium]|nr:radical SAM protein [Vicinamibacterales bacterium]